jgi:hypothetical protein
MVADEIEHLESEEGERLFAFSFGWAGAVILAGWGRTRARALRVVGADGIEPPTYAL